MSLTRKLLAAFGVMLALLLLLSGATMMVTRGLNQDLDRAANVTARRQYLAGDVRAATGEMSGLERGGVLDGVLGNPGRAEESLQTFRRRAGDLQRAIEELHKTSDSR